MSDEILKAKLEDFITHRANAARIAQEHGGQFAYLPSHPHDLLDATNASVRDYFFEVNASITALHECSVITGEKKASDKPELLTPHICECCTRLVIPVPDDLKRGQPIGSIQKTCPVFGPIGRLRHEAIYDHGPQPAIWRGNDA